MESSNEPVTSLGNRYTVDREIASGGGGSVYLAHDGVLYIGYYVFIVG